MSEERINLVYDPSKIDDKTKERLSQAGERSGFHRVERSPVNQPVAVKTCNYCKKGMPLTNKGFVCVRCLIISG